MSGPKVFAEEALYVVKVRGCDEVNKVLLALRSSEVDAIERLAGEVNKWGGGCYPTMHVRLATPADVESVEADQRDRGEREPDDE